MRSGIVLMAIVFGLTGCRSMNHDPVHFQFCLSKEEGDAFKLKEEVKRISRLERIDYFDWSTETQKLLEQSEDKFDANKSFPLINIAIRQRDGLGLGGGNAGLPANQVAFGFTVGSDKKESRKFAIRVFNRLSNIWKITEIFSRTGAFPLDRC